MVLESVFSIKVKIILRNSRIHLRYDTHCDFDLVSKGKFIRRKVLYFSGIIWESEACVVLWRVKGGE